MFGVHMSMYNTKAHFVDMFRVTPIYKLSSYRFSVIQKHSGEGLYKMTPALLTYPKNL